MKILIIGRYAWNAEDIADAIQNHPFKQDVIHYNYMQVEELCKVMGAAYALTFVSLFEGFGIPILEAMQCHIPCIVSNTSSMPEVIGNAGILVNPHNVEDIANAMRKMYKEEHFREQCILISKEQVKKFSWEDSATNFYTIVEKIATETKKQYT